MADWQYKGKLKVDQGYYAKLPNVEPTEATSNAYFVTGDGERIDLWITEFLAGFQMGGTFAQSQKRRQWFGRNFVQPRFTIIGQAPNQYHYNRLSEFVRATHLRALQDTNKNVIDLYVPEGKLPTKKYQAYHMRGYIENMERRNTRHVNAPQYQFEFVVAYSYVGLFQTGQEIVHAIKDWTGIFRHHATWIDDPDAPGAPPAEDPHPPGSTTGPGGYRPPGERPH